ncbi:methionyl-tRNA formyltransferase [Lancefieldella parvula]|uniref:methionyl-tRNA formyltransferase n=1 Tax=Lancefieldella parvula TaxID=1382 RepID=UPI0028E5201D|nr:methionyl-tRNA formyltransferase [Lancefieldella parvula]
MRVVFMGTPDFAVPSLKKLAHDHQVALVITRPDAVRGRGKTLEPSPVKECAQELDLPVLEANRMTSEVISAMRKVQPEVLCVVAFGCILPDEVISLAPYGVLNVHASLLPRWRGAAPIQRAILAGDAVAGVSIMKIAHELDAGDSCEIGSKNTEQLADALAHLGADALSEALSELKDGSLEWQEQDEREVTFAPKVTKQEMKLTPEDSARVNVLRVQASSDAAPARVSVGGRSLRVLSAQIAPSDVSVAQGSVTVQDRRLFLGCAEGSIELLEVRPDGKRSMDAQSFVAGLQKSQMTWQKL